MYLPTLVFLCFALATQLALVVFFMARRFAPGAAAPTGWLAYGLSAAGLPLGAWFLVSGEPWRLWVGPLWLGAWALFGGYVDLVRRVSWRSPLRLPIFLPFVLLYFFAQMFLWWPLWDMHRAGWTVFLALFVVNTALNLRGHFGPRD